MIKICFLIRRLTEGGAQRQLLNLIGGLDKAKFEVHLMTSYPGGGLSEELKSLPNVYYFCLEKKGRWDILPFFYRLIKRLRQIKPEILHSYLVSQNCMAVLIKPFLMKCRVAWGVRASNMKTRNYDLISRIMTQMESFLARFPEIIIVNSKAGFDHGLKNGFPKEKMVFIPNGIDTVGFQPDPEAGLRLRKEWGLQDGESLIGLIGRLDPMKDHPTFLKAASVLAKENKNVRFVCVGNGPEEYKDLLKSTADDLGLSDRLMWLKASNNMPAIYNSLDILCSSSAYGEGFSNVIGEAMACGVPCVVTDTGDSANILGETGIVVPPSNPGALATGLKKGVQEFDEALSVQARQRIEENFSINTLILRTEEVLTRLISPGMRRDLGNKGEISSFSEDVAKEKLINF